MQTQTASLFILALRSDFSFCQSGNRMGEGLDVLPEGLGVAVLPELQGKTNGGGRGGERERERESERESKRKRRRRDVPKKAAARDSEPAARRAESGGPLPRRSS